MEQIREWSVYDSDERDEIMKKLLDRGDF